MSGVVLGAGRNKDKPGMCVVHVRRICIREEDDGRGDYDTGLMTHMGFCSEKSALKTRGGKYPLDSQKKEPFLFFIFSLWGAPILWKKIRLETGECACLIVVSLKPKDECFVLVCVGVLRRVFFHRHKYTTGPLLSTNTNNELTSAPTWFRSSLKNLVSPPMSKHQPTLLPHALSCVQRSDPHLRSLVRQHSGTL